MKTEELKISKNKVARLLYLVLGFFFIGMGIIGIFLPVWPTTIFILLATWSFLRSSEKCYYWLTRNKYFGRIILNYRLYGGIERKTRTKSIIILWLTLLLSIMLVNAIWIWLLLIAVGIGVSWHLLSLRLLTNEEIERLNYEFDQ